MLVFNKHKKSYIILLVNLLLLAIGIVLYNKTEDVLRTDREERLVAKINLHIDSVLISVKDAQRGERGFIISGDKTYLQAFYNAKKRLNGLVRELETSLKAQKDIRRKFVASERLIVSALAKFDEIIKIREEERPSLAVLAKRDYEGKLFIDTLQNTIQSIEKYEKEKLNTDAQNSINSANEIVLMLVISGFVIVVMVVLLSTSLVNDILKREELSLKLEGSEKRYHFLFELSADGIIIADLDGIITDCNKAVSKIFGYSKQELLGKSYHIICPDEQKHGLPAKISRDTITGDRLIENTYVKKDGTVLNADVYTKLIEINGHSSVVIHVRDITEKKQAQKAIAKSEEKYRNLFERSLAGIFRTTLEGQIIECNDEYARVLGYKNAEEIKNISTKNIYADPTDREKLVALLRNEGEVKDLIMKLKKKNGSYAWVYDSVAMIYDDDLQKEVLFGTLVDITAQREAELLIAASERRYKDLAELLPQTVFEFDLNAKVTFANKAGFDAFGYTQEDFKKGLNVFQLIIQEDREKAKKHIEGALEGINQSNNEYTAVRKNGTTFPILIYSSLLIRNNKPEGIRGIVVDISELKQAEKEIRMLAHSLESISECVSITDDKNIIMYVNESFTKIYGFGKEELIGQHISIVQPRSLVTAEIQEDVLKFTNKGNWKGELINKRKDGSEFPVYLSTSIVKDSRNNPIALIGVAADITERKRAEEQILLLSRAVENSPATTIITDEEGNIEYVNRKFIELTGYTFEEVKGKNPRILSSGEKSKDEYKILWETIKSGKEWRGEFPNQKKNGELYWESATIVPIKNDRIFFLAIKEDITERKHAEEALKQQEAMLRVVLETLPVGVWVIDEKGTIKYGNREGEKIWAGTKLVGMEKYGEYKGWWADTGKRIEADEWAAARAITRGEISLNEEIRIECFDGTQKTILHSGVPLQDENQKITGAIIVNQDITDRKHAELEILRLNRVYSVLSNINQTIVRIKDKQQLLYAVCKIAIDDGKFEMSWIGLIDEETGELKVAAAHGLINGYLDDVIFENKNYPPGVKPVSEVINTGKPSIFNNIEVLDKHTFWRQAALNRGYKSNAVFPIKVFGKTIGNFSLFSDQIGFFEGKEVRLLEEMSEDISFALETMEIEKRRKESESLFLTLANISPVGIFRTRADGYTTYVNPKWCQLSGLKAEEAMGEGWLKAVHPEDRTQLAKGWKSATDIRQSSFTEYRFIHLDGKIAWVIGQAIPELNSGGEIEGYVGTITDITNIKLYEHELIKAKDAAENSERIKSEFLAQMSHEIRTPINVIVSSTSYLKDELEDKIEPELFTLFNSLDRAGKRIIRTVDLILNMAEIQTDSYHYTPIHVDISGDLLMSVYKEFISSAKEKNLEFNLHRKIGDAKVYVDEYSVRQMFCQLIDNAIKYTNEGKVNLTVDKDTEGKVIVSIADTGIGMSEGFVAQMYNPFTQEEQGYSRSFEGNGLGLALVKKYCDLNNATINVESIKGKGSVFTIKFNGNPF